MTELQGRRQHLRIEEAISDKSRFLSRPVSTCINASCLNTHINLMFITSFLTYMS